MNTIMMIEDQDIEQQAFAVFIKKYFPNLQLLKGVDNGIDGMICVEREQPDILVLDIQMPEMNGVELLERIRAAGYKGQIIIQTAYDYFSYVQRALNAGANAYILKPVSHSDMYRTICECQERVREQRENQRRTEEDKKKLHYMSVYITKDIIEKIMQCNVCRYIPQEILEQLGLQNISGFFLAIEAVGAGLPEQECTSLLERWNWTGTEQTEPHVILKKICADKMIAFVFGNELTDPFYYRREARRLMHGLADDILLSAGIHVRIGAGTVYTKILELYHSYQESWQALEDKKKEGRSSFYACTEKNRPDYDLQLWKRISLENFRTDSPEAQGIIEEIMTEISDYMTDLSMEECRYQAIEIYSSFCFYIAQDANAPEYISNKKQMMQEVEQQSNQEQLLLWLRQHICAVLTTGLDSNLNCSGNKILNDAMKYIQAHFNEDISLAQVAERTGVSSYYCLYKGVKTLALRRNL